MRYSFALLQTLILGVLGVSLAAQPRVLQGSEPQEASLTLVQPKADLNLSTKSALFGVPEYKTKLVAPLIYLKDKEEANKDSCHSYAAKFKEKVIVLVERGECHFVTKVRNAQEAGAAAVIVADSFCECHHNSKEVCKANNCAALEPYMADDGTGSDVEIPSVLIDLYDASQLIEFTKNGAEVFVSLEWKAPKATKHVNWELWTSSDETTSFKDNFKGFADMLKEVTTFTPRYFIWDGDVWGCTEKDNCGNQCIGEGKYCNPDPDGSLAEGFDGAAVVHENLRQACIWKTQIDFEKDGGAKWWDYVTMFKEECKHETPGLDPTDKDQFAKCSEVVHKAVGLDFSVTQRCSKIVNGRNELLDVELKSRMNGEGDRGEIVQLPTVIVNNLVERGGVTTAAVMDTLCAAFEEDSVPDVCKCVQSTPNRLVNQCLNEKANTCVSGGAYCSSTGECVLDIADCPTGMSGTSVFFVIVAVLAIAGGVGAVYFHHSRRQMREEMEGILRDYMPLEEMNNRGEGGTGTVGMI